MLDLEFLGGWGRRMEGDRDIVGDLIASDWNHFGIADRAVGEHRQIGGATTDVQQTDAQLLFVRG